MASDLSKYILVRSFETGEIVGKYKVKQDRPIGAQVRKILDSIDEDLHVIDMNGWEE